MAFYDLPKPEREALVKHISNTLYNEFKQGMLTASLAWFAADDTYIRKAVYQAIGRIYFAHSSLRLVILLQLELLMADASFKVRQTVINAAGEIGMRNFEVVKQLFDNGLLDAHHSPRNAVIGSVKKMGQVNPQPVLEWAKHYLCHPDKEIRREICHGIELRGRTHPQDILPLLQELENDSTARVRNTLVHVLGQIAYKPGCLDTVVKHLFGWQNRKLVADALKEIIDVHQRYQNFAALTQEQARSFIAASGIYNWL